MTKTKSFLWCFTILVFLELAVVSNPDWYYYRIFTKPLIVGSLLVFFLLQKTDDQTKVLVSAALLCTLIGDIQLIYSDDIELLFTGGLIAFLSANIIYIFQFSRNRDTEINFVVPSLILLLYGGALFWYLADSLGDLAIPVMIYIVSAWIMILFAYLREDEISDNGYIYVLTGSLLLMLTASIVAIIRFKSKIPYAGTLIMLIHSIAQLSLVMGILMSNELYKKQAAINLNDINKS